MAVRADERFFRGRKALEMDLMANPIAGTREANAVFFRYRLDITVIVGVFKARLQGVVVDVATESSVLTRSVPIASNCRYAIVPVASVSVSDRCEARFPCRAHLPRDKVGSDDFLCECVSKHAI